MIKKSIGCLLVILLYSTIANAAVWQWSITVRNSIENKGESRAFLWIPPTCTKVRGIVIAQHNMEEISILENQRFRSELGKLGFAEIWIAPPFDHLFRFNQGSGEVLDSIIKELSDLSGYTELKFSPLVPLGHSAAASWPYYYAAWKPWRTLACLSVSGQWPYVRNQFAPDIWGDRTINYVPCLETMGEYEAAATWSAEGLKERQKYPFLPLSMLACPAEGHFATTDEKVSYLAFYIRKAVQYRLTNELRPDSFPVLRDIDPTTTGWLAEKWMSDSIPHITSAPVRKYKGNPGDAFWFFDEEHVRVTEKYQSRFRNKSPQLVGFVQNGIMVKQQNTHLQVKLKFIPMNDGITFRLNSAFYNVVDSGSPRLSAWAGLPAGSKIGHAKPQARITIDKITGPFAKVSSDLFSLRLQRETVLSKDFYELDFVATHPGDKKYKPSVQQANMFVPARNKEGKQQQINFEKIANQKRSVKWIKLNAKSTSGLPVYFYVKDGPAEVKNNSLYITKIPPKSKFPLKITVVAWQYGRSVEPKVQTAESIEQSFYLKQ